MESTGFLLMESEITETKFEQEIRKELADIKQDTKEIKQEKAQIG